MKFISLTTTIMSAMMVGSATAEISRQSIIGRPCAQAGEYTFSVACFRCAAMRPTYLWLLAGRADCGILVDFNNGNPFMFICGPQSTIVSVQTCDCPTCCWVDSVSVGCTIDS